MSILGRPVFSTGFLFECDAIKDIVSPIVGLSAVCMDVSGANVILTSATADTLPKKAVETKAIELDRDVGALVSVEPYDLCIEDVAALCSLETEPVAEKWRAFRCRFESGVQDIFAVFCDGDSVDVAEFLGKGWPGLRNMCIEQVCHRLSVLSDDAMLWMVSQKVNACILVLDQDCNILKSNAAGQDLLAEGVLLRNSPRGLLCAREEENRALHQAIAECSGEDADQKAEFVLILRGPDKSAHIPMSLSPYRVDDDRTRLFLAMLPMPPEQKRIEDLARCMGLTPSEARVAALMRAGHSNRKAAELAGLKVETFNTYAKRVLSKLNVTCRAEMAQMLTWQASVERSL